MGGGYQPIIEEEHPEEMREESEQEIGAAETEEDSVIMRGDNLPIVDLGKYNTEGKELHYIQINHIVGTLTSNKKITEDRPYQEGRIRVHDGLKNAYCQNCNRSGANSRQE